MLGHHLLSWEILQSGFGDKLQTLPQAEDHSHPDLKCFGGIHGEFLFSVLEPYIHHCSPPELDHFSHFFPEKPGWKPCHSSYPKDFQWNFPRHAGRRVEVFPASASSKGQEVVSWLRPWTKDGNWDIKHVENMMKPMDLWEMWKLVETCGEHVHHHLGSFEIVCTNSWYDLWT